MNRNRLKCLLPALLWALMLIVGAGRSGAQTTFTNTGSGVVWTTSWFNDTYLGHNVTHSAMNQSEIDGRFTGTQLELQVNAFYSTSAFAAVVVDGAIITPGTISAVKTWQWVTMATGLADTTHTFSIHFSVNNSSDGIFVDRDASFRVTGAAPAMSAPAGWSTLLWPTDATTLSHIRNDFADYTVRGGAQGIEDWFPATWADNTLTFRATCSSIWIWAYGGSSKVRIRIDPSTPNATEPATVTLHSGTYYTWVQIASGLDAGAEHVYQINLVSPPGATGSIAGLMLPGGSGLNTTNAVPSYSTAVLAGYGDSITAGGTVNDSSIGFVHKIANAKGWDFANRGISSTTTYKFASGASTVTTQSGENRTADVTGLSRTPTVVTVMYGTNDAWQIGGAETAAQYQGAYYRMMNALTTALPTTKFICVSLLPSTNTNIAANRTTFNAAAHSAVTSGGDGVSAVLSTAQKAQITWVDSDTFSLNTGSDLADGVHPNATGYTKIANALLQYIGATIFRRAYGPRTGSRTSQ